MTTKTTHKRIVVKVGSNVLTRKDGKLDVTRMSALVDQIAWLRKQDIEVILVSSGAMASGRGELKVDHSLDSVEQRQLFSAVGQVKLVGLYYDLFREFNIHVGQVLTMKENFQPGELACFFFAGPRWTRGLNPLLSFQCWAKGWGKPS